MAGSCKDGEYFCSEAEDAMWKIQKLSGSPVR